MGPLSWNAAKIVLAAGTPIHLLVAGRWDTHSFINCQGIMGAGASRRIRSS